MEVSSGWVGRYGSGRMRKSIHDSRFLSMSLLAFRRLFNAPGLDFRARIFKFSISTSAEKAMAK